MNTKKRLVGLAAVGSVLTGAAVIAGIGTAAAAPALGNLVISPATGNANTLLTASTAPGDVCPVDTTGIIIDMAGAGITPGNGALQGFTDIAQVQDVDNITAPVASKFVDVFQGNAIAAPSGDYTVRIACIGADSFTEVGEFSLVTTWTPTGVTNQGTYVSAVAAQSTSTVLSGPASSSFGDSVTLTAAVTPAGATGTVQFKDGGADLGTPQPVSAGTASFTTSSLGAGSHSLTAQYLPAGPDFTGSTSAAHTLAVAATSTALGLTSNGPTAEFAPATFTATVTPAAAGTVTFTEGAVTLGTSSVDGAGVATFSSTSLAAGTHSVSASFAPSDAANVSPAAAGPISHVVTAFAGASLTQNVVVAVPAGSLTIVLDDGADGLVDLGTAVMNGSGDLLTAQGELDVVKITDTRAGDPGWQASGIVTDFSNGTDSVNGFNLGWVPSVASLSANQAAAFVPGGTVVAGAEPTAATTPALPTVGLESSRVLGTAPNNSGNGTARLGAHLDLNIPTDVSAGVYAATLTLTVI